MITATLGSLEIGTSCSSGTLRVQLLSSEMSVTPVTIKLAPVKGIDSQGALQFREESSQGMYHTVAAKSRTPAPRIFQLFTCHLFELFRHTVV